MQRRTIAATAHDIPAATTANLTDQNCAHIPGKYVCFNGTQTGYESADGITDWSSINSPFGTAITFNGVHNRTAAYTKIYPTIFVVSLTNSNAIVKLYAFVDTGSGYWDTHSLSLTTLTSLAYASWILIGVSVSDNGVYFYLEGVKTGQTYGRIECYKWVSGTTVELKAAYDITGHTSYPAGGAVFGMLHYPDIPGWAQFLICPTSSSLGKLLFDHTTETFILDATYTNKSITVANIPAATYRRMAYKNHKYFINATVDAVTRTFWIEQLIDVQSDSVDDFKICAAGLLEWQEQDSEGYQDCLVYDSLSNLLLWWDYDSGTPYAVQLLTGTNYLMGCMDGRAICNTNSYGYDYTPFTCDSCIITPEKAVVGMTNYTPLVNEYIDLADDSDNLIFLGKLNKVPRIRAASKEYTYLNIIQLAKMQSIENMFTDLPSGLFDSRVFASAFFCFDGTIDDAPALTSSMSSRTTVEQYVKNFGIFNQLLPTYRKTGEIEVHTPADSGLDLTTATFGSFTVLDEGGAESDVGTVIVNGGFANGAKIEKSASNNNGSSHIVSFDFPEITDADEAQELANNLLLMCADIGIATVQLTRSYPPDIGDYVDVSMMALVDLYPYLGNSVTIWLIENWEFDAITQQLTLNLIEQPYTQWVDEEDGLNALAAVDGLAQDVQTNGNIYLPYFQATNYNPATSSWVSQACSDNTVTPLNLYNIVQKEGGWTWSSSARTKVYVPTGGWYLFQARVQFEGNSSGTRQARLRIDGVNADTHMVAAFLTQGSVDTIVNATGMGWVDAGSYVELCGLQDTSPGVSLNMKYCGFSIVRLSI